MRKLINLIFKMSNPLYQVKDIVFCLDTLVLNEDEEFVHIKTLQIIGINQNANEVIYELSDFVNTIVVNNAPDGSAEFKRVCTNKIPENKIFKDPKYLIDYYIRNKFMM